MVIYSFLAIPILVIVTIIAIISLGVFAFKRKMSFGQILAIFGAILIAVGFAWLLAQNWHYIPAALKIAILLIITAGAYILGVVLKEKDYPTIAKAMFILGALMYTLSVFLIAQIFSTTSSLQNLSWLLLLSWIGVAFSSYLFSSYTTFLIAIIQFLTWLPLQFFALLVENTSNLLKGGNFPVIVVFAFLFLAAGTFFYGLSLWHRAYEHKFARLFKWLTAFYVIVFTYILTFQIVLPYLWSTEIGISGLSGPVVFLTCFVILALISLISGIIIALDKSRVSGKEIIAVLAIIVLLSGLILLAKLPANSVGTCYKKYCNDFRTETNCGSAPSNLHCEWRTYSNELAINSGGNIPDGYCAEESCDIYNSQDKCENAPSRLNCRWNGNYCNVLDCYSILEKELCEENKEKLGCEWGNKSYQSAERCSRVECFNYQDKSSCESSPDISKCSWNNNRCSYDYKSVDNCNTYNNNHDQCVSQNECKWSSSFNFSSKNAPFSLWFVWIIVNIFFLLLILGIIAYGTSNSEVELINLGILAFGIDIITRYIGFIVDLWGYTSMAILFIIGGGILAFGGWLVERWRRKLINQAKTVQQPSQYPR